MPSEYDAVVLGLGGIGSGCTYWLARSGARVLGLEQFDLGHARGESHDHSRIIRLSYHTKQYVGLAQRAYDAWKSVEQEAQKQLIYVTGGLDIGFPGSAIPLEGYANAMRACDVAFDELDADGLRRRYPQFTFDDNVRALYQADAGIIAAERATAIHQRLAQEHGATLHANERVLRLHDDGSEIAVETDADTYYARMLIVAAGPWTAAALRHFEVTLPLEVTKEQPMYFSTSDLEEFAPGRFPIWIWMDDPSFYGFPVFGEPAVKVTQDAGGKPVDPDTRTFEPDADITMRVETFVRRHLPALGDIHLVKTCLYTLTPDRDFVIDTLTEHPRVYVAIGAGHAFKFASLIGRIFSDLATRGNTEADITAFSLQRPILRMTTPPKTYMV